MKGTYRKGVLPFAVVIIASVGCIGTAIATSDTTWPGTLGGTYSEAWGVNADGSVVVGYSHLTGDTAIRAFRWTASDNTMHDLGTLGGSYSAAWGVNADG